MESLLLLVIVVLALTLMIFGHITKIGVFNLASIPFFIVLAVELQAHVGLVIGFIALIIFEFYFAFIGNTNL